MLHHVLEVLKYRCLLDFDHPVVLGVSGGSDSLCMLFSMQETGIPLIVAHYNHHMRSEADQEAEQVKRWVEDLGLPFVYGERKIEGGIANHINEETARQKRYEFLFEVARINQAQAVAVAHNADDQVETILLHILRGSGLSGLTGMAFYSLPNAWSREIPLVRPLLSTWRQDIDAFINAKDLSPNIDGSNFDVSLLRNRVRQELIPYLQTYSPQIKRQLLQMAEILTDEEAMITGEVDRTWDECYTNLDENHVELNSDCFRSLKVNIQRRMVRKAIGFLVPSMRDIDYGIIDRFIALSRRNKNYQNADLGEGLHLTKNGKRVIVTKGKYGLDENLPQMDDGVIIPVKDTGMIPLSPSWKVDIDQVTLNDNERQRIDVNTDANQLWLDVNLEDMTVIFRARKKGDTFCPLGMGGRRLKLSDFMINEKIPRSQRANWPLVEVNGEIVWVVGRRAGHHFRVTTETRQTIHLTLIQKPKS